MFTPPKRLSPRRETHVAEHKAINRTSSMRGVAHALRCSRVKKGQLIGIVADTLTGKVAERVVAPKPGLLFTLREYPVVYPGSLIGRILKDDEQ